MNTIRSLRVVSPLAVSDLRDEGLLSFCLVASIAAVVAPIMVLAGLKFGFVEILRNKLIQDPTFRLISPIDASTRPTSFFDQLRRDPRVAFLQPNVTLSGTSARLELEQAGTIDILPTSLGDPLIVEHGGTVPVGDEITLTQSAAESLGTQVGSTGKLVITRVNANRRETQSIAVSVRSVVPAAADPGRRAYLALPLVESIERYRLGLPIPERSWPGRLPPPLQSFDALILALAAPLDEGELLELKIRNGFEAAQLVDRATVTRDYQVEPPVAAQQLIVLRQSKRPVTARQTAALGDALASREHWLLPITEGLSVRMGSAGASFGLKTYDGGAFRIAGETSGDLDQRTWNAEMPLFYIDRVVVPALMANTLSLKTGDKIEMKYESATASGSAIPLAFPVTVVGTTGMNDVFVHPALAGALRESQNTALEYDASLHALVPSQVGYRGFRLYGKTIDDVPPLVRALEAQGVEVRAKSDAIEQLKRLDLALTWITAMVGLVSLVGGTAILVSSFFASVERKKADLALLRLAGFSKASIFLFPIVQGVVVALIGCLTATLLFFGFASLINAQFAKDMAGEANLCRLAPWHIGSFVGLVLLATFVSSTIAARRTLAIDPAEALRHD